MRDDDRVSQSFRGRQNDVEAMRCWRVHVSAGRPVGLTAAQLAELPEMRTIDLEYKTASQEAAIREAYRAWERKYAEPPRYVLVTSEEVAASAIS